jgi:hypothetical protein
MKKVVLIAFMFQSFLFISQNVNPKEKLKTVTMQCRYLEDNIYINNKKTKNKYVTKEVRVNGTLYTKNGTDADVFEINLKNLGLKKDDLFIIEIKYKGSKMPSIFYLNRQDPVVKYIVYNN